VARTAREPCPHLLEENLKPRFNVSLEYRHSTSSVVALVAVFVVNPDDNIQRCHHLAAEVHTGARSWRVRTGQRAHQLTTEPESVDLFNPGCQRVYGTQERMKVLVVLVTPSGTMRVVRVAPDRLNLVGPVSQVDMPRSLSLNHPDMPIARGTVRVGKLRTGTAPAICQNPRTAGVVTKDFGGGSDLPASSPSTRLAQSGSGRPAVCVRGRA
jgi:hypothetical protein